MFLNENQFEKQVELKNKLTSFIYKLRIFKFERICIRFTQDSTI